MPKVTFEVTPAQKRLMERLDEVNWSAVLRRAVDEHAAIMRHVRAIEEETNDPLVREFGAKIKRGMAERYERTVRARRR